MSATRLNPNEIAFDKGNVTNTDLFIEKQPLDGVNQPYKASVQDKFGWLTEVEKIMHQMVKYGDERIPDEFKVKTDMGIVVWLRNISKAVQGGHIGERLGIVIGDMKEPVIIGFSDGNSEKDLWVDGPHTRYHRRDFKQFERDIKPFDVEWLYASWQRAVDFAYLLLPNDKISARLLQACRNQEIRKHLVKRFGQERFKSGEGKLIHEEYQFLGIPHTPELLERFGKTEQIVKIDSPQECPSQYRSSLQKSGQYLFDVEIDGRMHRFVFVKDASTPREYILEVPNTDDRNRGFGAVESDFPITTVRAAVAWTFRMKPEEYIPLAET